MSDIGHHQNNYKKFFHILLNKDWLYGCVSCLIYLAFLLPILIYKNLDFSIFIVAGDKFADSHNLVAPIHIQSNSTGFDGQFYYRIALAPFDFQTTSYGLTIDDPPLRFHRILYPLLVWIFAFGQKSYVSFMMFFVNLCGIVSIFSSCSRLVKYFNLNKIVLLYMLLWPGFLISLTHDTTEIISSALILLSLEAYVKNRTILLFVFPMLAAFTRETGVIFIFGLFVFSIYNFIRDNNKIFFFKKISALLACMLPFLVFQIFLKMKFGHSPASADAVANLGWPLRGVLETIGATLDGSRMYVHQPVFQNIMRFFVVYSILLLVLWSSFVIYRAYAVKKNYDSKLLIATFLPFVFILFCLTGKTGPWVDPISYFRAFTECFILGSFICTIEKPQRPSNVVLSLCAELSCFTIIGGMLFVALALK
ncbi:hypothetical protein [Acetobacter indonesiensis]|uniref:hypothetical protein n=1 Tax=Acetobacter indonesiensis TaxID=104101 RepID=UPI000662147F|nr:hypothetical protein [Acetobacter indonesiensis]